MELKELTVLSGVSGNEGEVRNAIMKALDSMGVPYETDIMGNIIARKGNTGPKLMVDAHMDEVGLMVMYIEKNGFLRFASIGMDPGVLVSKKVLVGDKRIPGVIGAKAIHLQKPEEREKTIPLDMLFIDIGAKSQKEAEEMVTIGDYAVFDTVYEEISPGIIKAKALDDRVGCALLLELLKEDWDSVQLCAIFSVQEEVGFRGATVAAYNIEPDMGIALEGTICADIPGTDKEYQVTRLGAGVALSIMDRGSISNRSMLNKLMEIARENKISYQLRESAAGANDGKAIQSAREGCPTVTLSVPCRYIHSPASLMSMDDYYAARDLMIKFIKSIEGGFRP